MFTGRFNTLIKKAIVHFIFYSPFAVVNNKQNSDTVLFAMTFKLNYRKEENMLNLTVTNNIPNNWPSKNHGQKSGGGRTNNSPKSK